MRNRQPKTYTRLTRPLVRDSRDEPFREASWEEALDRAAHGLERHRGAFGMFSCARATNEMNYVAQKFARVVMGTNNVDSCNRTCHAPSVAGLSAAFGCGGGTSSYEEAEHTDVIVMWGSNARFAHPIFFQQVDLSTTPRAAEWIKEYEAKPDRFGPGSARLNEEPKVDNELYVRDYDKCILCYKCVDACGDQWQNTFAISVAGRGFDARIAVEHEAPPTDPACVYCGNCIEVCPTGALSFRSEFDMRAAGTWDESKQSETTTVCAYCGVGCNLTLHVQDNEIVKVTSPHDNPVTHGNLCIKGRFGYQHVQNRG